MCASARENLARPSIAQDIVAKARERLKMAAYPSVRSVSCDLEDGVLFLWYSSTFLRSSLPRRRFSISTA